MSILIVLIIAKHQEISSNIFIYHHRTRRSIAGGCISRESSNFNTSMNMKPGHFNFNNAFIQHKKP